MTASTIAIKSARVGVEPVKHHLMCCSAADHLVVFRSFRLWELPRVPQDNGMVVSAEEDRLIGQVVDRLQTGFPHVPQDTVHELVGSVHHQFDDAPIRDFVPLFVERHAKEKLANLAGDAPHPV